MRRPVEISALNFLRAEVDRLRAAADDAFMAMCAYRDNKDDECFQDAIDALGLALNRKE
jgi:hypothetical protein